MTHSSSRFSVNCGSQTTGTMGAMA